MRKATYPSWLHLMTDKDAHGKNTAVIFILTIHECYVLAHLSFILAKKEKLKIWGYIPFAWIKCSIYLDFKFQTKETEQQSF